MAGSIYAWNCKSTHLEQIGNDTGRCTSAFNTTFFKCEYYEVYKKVKYKYKYKYINKKKSKIKRRRRGRTR